MGKKKLADLQAERQVFVHGCPSILGKPAVQGCVANGVPEDVANALWDQMEKFGSYAFNKSHAAAYSYVTYQTAWLKYYYEPEFLTAILNNRITKSDDLKKYLAYAKSVNIQILPPDVNESKTLFSVKGETIRFGLSAIKGIGGGICDQIIKEREENGPFTSLENFLSRTVDFNLNKRLIEGFISAGAFDCFGKKRSQLIAVYEKAMACAVKDSKSRSAGQFSMFGMMDADEAIKIDYPNLPEFENMEKLKKEKEVCGIYISGNPLDTYLSQMINYTFNSTMIQEGDDDGVQAEESEQSEFVSDLKDGMQVECGGIVSAVKRIMTKQGNKPMAIITVEDIYGEFDCMMFPKTYEKFGSTLESDRIVQITGKISIRVGEKPIILIENIKYLDEKSAEPIEQKQDAKTAFVQEVKPEQEKLKKVYLQFDITNQNLVETLNDIVSSYPGKSPVFVQYNRKLYPLGFNVEPTNAMVAEISRVIGQDNIKIM